MHDYVHVGQTKSFLVIILNKIKNLFKKIVFFPHHHHPPTASANDGFSHDFK